jgi:RNA recognition motif-containing protein
LLHDLDVFHIAARVITDRETGRSRGFGFVNFAEEEAAKAAVTGMDGQVSRNLISALLLYSRLDGG